MRTRKLCIAVHDVLDIANHLPLVRRSPLASPLRNVEDEIRHLVCLAGVAYAAQR
jgi:hypothetical protein